MREPAERMLRDLNDRLYALLSDLKAAEGTFDCECGDRECGRSAELSLTEYLAIRRDGGVVLSPEHSRGLIQ
jgi:hypothetical protein